MEIFEYGEREIDYLSRCDEALGTVIRQIGRIERKVTSDLFVALTESIIGQQISNRAMERVVGRFRALLAPVTPERVLQTGRSAIKECGMSFRKADYILTAAQAFFEGRIKVSDLVGLTDQEVIVRLTQLPGVGVWTAEMLLLFSMQRPDVLSYNDLVIRRSLMTLHGLPEMTRADFDRYRRLYSPYGSVASLYLWAADKLPIRNLTDGGAEK